MHHRRTGFGRRATSRRGDRSARILVVTASWLLSPSWSESRAGAAEEQSRGASVSADLDRELRQQVRPLLDRY
jgi:hypothetical protein